MPDTLTRAGPPNASAVEDLNAPKDRRGRQRAAPSAACRPSVDSQHGVLVDVQGDELCFLSSADDGERRRLGIRERRGCSRCSGDDPQGPVGVVVPLVVLAGSDSQSLPRRPAVRPGMRSTPEEAGAAMEQEHEKPQAGAMPDRGSRANRDRCRPDHAPLRGQLPAPHQRRTEEQPGPQKFDSDVHGLSSHRWLSLG